MIRERTPISTGETTVMMLYPEKLQLKTRQLARETIQKMAKKKDDSQELYADVIRELLLTLAQDREFVRDELTKARERSDETFQRVFEKIEGNHIEHTKLNSRFKIYEKLLWIITGAFVYGWVPKIIGMIRG